MYRIDWLKLYSIYHNHIPKFHFKTSQRFILNLYRIVWGPWLSGTTDIY